MDATDYFRAFGIERLQPGAPAVAIYEYTRGPRFDVDMTAAVEVVLDEDTERGSREVQLLLRWFHDHIRDTVFQRLEPLL